VVMFATLRGPDQAGVAHLDNPSHTFPVMVCDAVLCKLISDVLIDRYGIYVQPINYPRVPEVPNGCAFSRRRTIPMPISSMVRRWPKFGRRSGSPRRCNRRPGRDQRFVRADGRVRRNLRWVRGRNWAPLALRKSNIACAGGSSTLSLRKSTNH
jgi:hypothetical protein